MIDEKVPEMLPLHDNYDSDDDENDKDSDSEYKMSRGEEFGNDETDSEETYNPDTDTAKARKVYKVRGGVVKETTCIDTEMNTP